MTVKLPYVTPELAGIGGTIKASPDDFSVEEIPVYAPSGEGEHVFVRLRRSGTTTRDVQMTLSRLFSLPEVDIGYAGMKDKIARTDQTFSLRNGKLDLLEVRKTLESETDFEIVDIKRHGNKLRLGHLIGNRFRIVISDPIDHDAVSRAQEIADRLVERGVPNFFGPQRFGLDGRNAASGRDCLLGRGPRKAWLARLYVSAFQSQLFNDYLALRMERGEYGRIHCGDVAKKAHTGGIFDVLDEAIENARFGAREITYTGPMFGKSMRPAQGLPGSWEKEIWETTELDPSVFDRTRLEGTRRPCVLWIEPITIKAHERGIEAIFALPKGAYATVCLGEIMKSAVSLEEGDDD